MQTIEVRPIESLDPLPADAGKWIYGKSLAPMLDGRIPIAAPLGLAALNEDGVLLDEQMPADVLRDVDQTAPADGDTLVWDAGKWKPAAAGPGGGGGMANPMTAIGDMIVGGVDGVPEAVGIGSDGQVWTMNAGAPAWMDPPGDDDPPAAHEIHYDNTASGLDADSAQEAIDALAEEIAGLPALTGMSNPMLAAGDIIYGGAGGSPVRLPVGTNGWLLGVVSGNPTYQALGTGGWGIALLASPALTGTPTAPTASAGTSTTQIATCAFVNSLSVQEVTSSATVTPTFTNDAVNISALAVNLTLANPSGTAVNRWGIVITIKDNGTSRTITFGSKYKAIDGVTLPAATTVGKTTILPMVYDSASDKWWVTGAMTV